jgi:hypothetical protein
VIHTTRLAGLVLGRPHRGVYSGPPACGDGVCLDQLVKRRQHSNRSQLVVRIALLVNPANDANTEATLQDVQEAAPSMGLQIQIFNASTIAEIDAAFASLARERPDARFGQRILH